MGYKVIGQGEKWTVIQGDILDYLAGSLWQRQYEGAYFHFAFADWPYNLDSITKRFGSQNSAPAQFGRDGAFARQSAGFMGARWDTDLAYQPETWAALLPHLHPGGFTASFTHPRKQHRLAMAQEAAGYVMNPALYQLGWIFASGKPNGSRVDLMCDKRAGAERGGRISGGHIGKVHNGGDRNNAGAATFDKMIPHIRGKGEITSGNPASPLACTWTGHQYGSPLAPELEPIIIAQAPWSGDRLDTITTTGAGAVNIDNGKNGMPGRGHPGHLVITHHPGCVYRREKMIDYKSGPITGNAPSPTTKNVYQKDYPDRLPWQKSLDDSGMLSVPSYDCHPDCPVAKLDAQTGDEKSYHFYQADWQAEITERLAGVDPVFYHGKVTESERNAGLRGMPLSERRRVNPGGLEREPRFAPTWQENNHPCLKPIKLCKWIAGLFAPPVEYAPRRVLIPTSGTGSEAIGCLLSGQWDEIIAVELDPKFADISCRRLEWWADWLRFGQDDPKAILKADDEPAQIFMF